MTFKSLITVTAVAFLFVATTNAAVAAEETREVSDFDAVTFGGSGDITITVGDALVNVSGELEAIINGSGDIEYIGEPANIKSSIRGSGDIHQR